MLFVVASLGCEALLQEVGLGAGLLLQRRGVKSVSLPCHKPSLALVVCLFLSYMPGTRTSLLSLSYQVLCQRRRKVTKQLDVLCLSFQNVPCFAISAEF